MKRQIRRGVFETNSSSTHAICITKDESYGLGTHIDFEVGEFGWENEEYDDVHSKASYLITAILTSNQDEVDRRLQLLKDALDSNNITYTLPKFVKKSWEYDGEKEYYYDIDGYIDHAGETKEFLDDVLSDSDRLFRYLFGDSFIITGNDNSDGYRDRMYVNEGKEETSWGTYTNYGGLKSEFDNYEVYEKGN